MGRLGWIVAAVLGGAAVVGIAYAASGGAATAGGSSPSSTFTLAPGAQQLTAKAGQQVTLQPPPGATWTSLTGFAGIPAVTPGTKTPVTFTAPAAGTYAIGASWTDAGGAPMGAVIGFTVS